MILCLTPNPAVDRTLVVPGFVAGSVQRAAGTLVAAGGKGLNAARAIRNLGGQPLCMGFLGGRHGHWLAALAAEEDLPAYWTWIEAETRMCLIVAAEAGQEATVINEAGPPVSEPDWERLTAEVLAEGAACRWVGVSGSLPPGNDLQPFTTLLARLVDSQKQTWVDTSGPALRAASEVPGVCLKVNGEEAGAILGAPITTTEDALQAARRLCQQGLRAVVITMGGAGAILVDGNDAWRARPPALQAASAVGSGDSFLGGLLLGFHEGLPAPEALRQATAAGAANALSIGGGRFTLADAQEAARAVRIEGV